MEVPGSWCSGQLPPLEGARACVCPLKWLTVQACSPLAQLCSQTLRSHLKVNNPRLPRVCRGCTPQGGSCRVPGSVVTMAPRQGHGLFRGRTRVPCGWVWILTAPPEPTTQRFALSWRERPRRVGGVANPTRSLECPVHAVPTPRSRARGAAAWWTSSRGVVWCGHPGWSPGPEPGWVSLSLEGRGSSDRVPWPLWAPVLLGPRHRPPSSGPGAGPVPA